MTTTLTRRIAGAADIYFAVGGTGAPETFTYTTEDGLVLTFEKIDAAHIKFRALAKTLDDLVDGGKDVHVKTGLLTVGGAASFEAAAAFAAIPTGPASDPTTASQLARKAFVDGSPHRVYGASAVGTDDYAITPAAAIAAYAAGQVFQVKADVGNTAAATLTVSGLTAKDIKKWKNGALAALETGDIIAAQAFAVVYDGTQFILISPYTRTLRIGHTWTVPGTVAVPSSDVDFICPFFVSLPTGQYASIVAAEYKINSGTSATVSVQKNGSNVTGLTALTVGTTTTLTDPADVALADRDKLALVVTGVSATPKNMTFTLFIEYRF